MLEDQRPKPLRTSLLCVAALVVAARRLLCTVHPDLSWRLRERANGLQSEEYCIYRETADTLAERPQQLLYAGYGKQHTVACGCMKPSAVRRYGRSTVARRGFEEVSAEESAHSVDRRTR